MAKILIVSMAPVFAEHIHGGSQKILMLIACHLGAKGHRVRILCTERTDIPACFSPAPNVEVFADLPFKQPFPDPFRTSPARIAIAFEHLHREGKDADVVYLHDGSIFAYELFDTTPVVISIRDFLYSESIIGLFSFRRDKMIVNSQFARDTAIALLNRFDREIDGRVELVPNGIDCLTFYPVDKAKSRKLLNIDQRCRCLLFPHRSVLEKGLSFLLRTVQELERRNIDRLLVLLPIWIDFNVDQEQRRVVSRMRTLWQEYGLQTKLQFVEWQAQERMRFLYSAADLTLCLGNAPESFGGNVVLESLACRTPVLVTNVGGYRTTVPETWVHKVNYGFELDAADCIEAALAGKKKPTPKIMRLVCEKFSHKKMLQRYEEILLSTTVSLPRIWRVKPKSKMQHFKIAPWCTIIEQGYYDDFSQKYDSPDCLHEFLLKYSGETFSISDAVKFGLSQHDIRRAYKQGRIVEI